MARNTYHTINKLNLRFIIIRCANVGSKGGVITLVKEYLNYTQLSNPANIECIRIQIKLVSSYLTVANIYLPPDKAIDKGELSKIFGHQTI